MEYAGIIRDICSIFDRNSVEYMIIGGTAVALHGYYRKSTTQSGAIVDKPDIDFWYNPTYENYYNLLNALEELGIVVSKFREDTSPDPKNSFFRYDLEEYSLDILPVIKAPIRFWDAFRRKEHFYFDGVEISFIGLEDLLKDKEVSARPKDINDVENLKRENGFNSF